MKNLSLIVLIFLAGIFRSYGQADSICAVKIGSNYYINCKRIISFQKQPVFTIENSLTKSININFDVFSENGKKVATVKHGKLVLGTIGVYKIISTENEFSLIEKATNRIICFVKKIYVEKNMRCELHVSVDMYMPSGFYFQCTPEITNVEYLNNIQGSTFANSLSVFEFN